MTLDEFFVALEKERGRDWVDGSFIRARATLAGATFASRCPLTAVAETACGADLLVGQVADAARLLGLSSADASDVANAADNRTFPLRARILAALDLPAEAP